MQLSSMVRTVCLTSLFRRIHRLLRMLRLRWQMTMRASRLALSLLQPLLELQVRLFTRCYQLQACQSPQLEDQMQQSSQLGPMNEEGALLLVCAQQCCRRCARCELGCPFLVRATKQGLAVPLALALVQALVINHAVALLAELLPAQLAAAVPLVMCGITASRRRWRRSTQDGTCGLSLGWRLVRMLIKLPHPLSAPEQQAALALLLVASVATELTQLSASSMQTCTRGKLQL